MAYKAPEGNGANLVEITVDVTELPTLDDLHRYNVAAMRVTTIGPGGGNPCVTLTFGSEFAKTNMLKFVKEWMDSTPEDLNIAA